MKKWWNILLEKQLFGVCKAIGDKVGLSENRIRLYFIYTSFFTLGLPFVFYLISAFWINIKRYFFERKRSMWEF